MRNITQTYKSSFGNGAYILRDIFPKILKYIIIFSFSSYSHAQSSSDTILPSYKGGLNQLWYDYNKLISGINWPKEGEIEVAFVVAKDGSIKNARIIKGLSIDDDKKVLSLINYSSRKWYPALDGGTLINMDVLLSFTFKQKSITISDVRDFLLRNNLSETTNNKNDWPQLTNHKTYEGEFAAFDLPKQSGKAKYQYIEKEGKQILDGRFVFISKHFKAEGQFSNDYQVGRWEFTQGRLKSIINFDRDGIPDGNFFIYSTYRNVGNDGADLIFSPNDACFGYMSDGKFKTVSSLTEKGYVITSDYTYFSRNQKLISRKVEGRNDIEWSPYNGFYILDSNEDENRIDVGKEYITINYATTLVSLKIL